MKRTTNDRAIRFLHEIKHASGQNYTIGGIQKASSYECTANKVRRFGPCEDAIRLFQTNHPMVNDDQSIYKELLERVKDQWQPRHPDNSDIVSKP